MTGPEVTAAMKAEDVDAGLVEKAARAVWNSDPAVIDGDVQDWDAPDIDFGDINEAVRNEERQTMRHALAAVVPVIQAQALREREGLRDELEAFRDDLTALREGLMERIGRYTPSDADLLAYVDTLKAQIAAQEPAGATQGGSGDSRTLADRLRAAADYQDRPGAYGELRAMADEVHRLEVHARVVEQSLRTARGEAKS